MNSDEDWGQDRNNLFIYAWSTGVRSTVQLNVQGVGLRGITKEAEPALGLRLVLGGVQMYRNAAGVVHMDLICIIQSVL